MKTEQTVFLSKKGKRLNPKRGASIRGKFLGPNIMFPLSKTPQHTGEYWVFWEDGMVGSYKLDLLRPYNFFDYLKDLL